MMFSPVSVCLLAGVLIELWMYLDETYMRASLCDKEQLMIFVKIQCSNLHIARVSS